jgi:ABC-type uncharacterized transport system involved in gliding motility auxiliary subunit
MGGMAALVTIIVIAAAVLVNLIAARIPLKMDLSEFQLYSLSDQTKGILAALADDVTLYACFKEGNAPSEIAEALKRYADASPRVSMRYIDLERDPGFAKRFAGPQGDVAPGSLVVANSSGERFRTIQYFELYELGYDQNTGRQTVRGVQLERQVSAALAYVASGVTYKLYELAGHGEDSLSWLGLADELSRQSNELAALNLLTQGQVPDDADLVLILAPETDIQASEADALSAWLGRGGKLLALLYPGLDAPNLAGLLEPYGVAWTNGIVMEGDQNRRIAGNPFFLLPNLLDHAINAPISKARLGVTYPITLALRESSLKRRDATLVPLLQSSYNSWLRQDLNDATPSQKAGEARGPHTLAYAVEVYSDKGDGSRLVVAGSSFFINPGNPAMAPGNRDLFLNMLSWTLNRKEGTGIAPKYFFSLPLQTDGLTAMLLLAIFVVLIPGGILVAGLIVWLRRRNR